MVQKPTAGVQVLLLMAGLLGARVATALPPPPPDRATIKLVHNRVASILARRYPQRTQPHQRHVKGEPNNIITYGLEGEFDLRKAPAVLDWYRPEMISDARWVQMSRDQQLAHAGPGHGLVKTSRAPEWLMERTEKDPGGIEIITKPVKSLEQALSIVRTVERQLGRRQVYWQANVGFERHGDFARRANR